MRTLYLDCGMGAAGDMLTAALLELLPDPEGFVAELNALGIPGVTFTRERCVKCGITGTRVSVKVHGAEEGEEPRHHEHEHEHEHEHGHHHHHHSGMAEVSAVIEALSIPEKAKQDALAVYRLLAEAESRAHGLPVDEIHFHEVGTMDAIADITAVCLLMERLAPELVAASPVHVGSGQVHCAHGILPVPAPATAFLLQDVPIYGGKVDGELCTPTGAALLKHFVQQFGDMPVLRPSAVGYGMGKRDFAAANCVRAFLGETEGCADEVCELSCNLDDMTAEAVGFAMERLFDAGALEVYTVPAGMKKSRPGVLLQVLCRREDRDAMVRAIFRHTRTIGVRETVCRRYVLDRETRTIDTPAGPARQKISSGYGVTRRKWEYEDLARIARERGLSLDEARALAEGR